MSEYHSPHDKFFKEIFSQLDLAEDLFRNYLPPFIASKIKPNTLKRLDDSFVDENLKSHFADLLFRVELLNSTNAYIYLLFEHKSSPDKFVAFQILRYMTRIWEKSLAEKEKSLPLVLPIVFYHGKRKWKVSENFSNLFEIHKDLENIRDFMPEFRYFLLDVNKYEDENLAGEAALQVILQFFKHIFDDDLQSKLTVAFKKLIQQTDREKAFKILLVVINYILQTGKLGETELSNALTKTEEEIGEEVMITVLDRKFAEGKASGLRIGEEKGVQIGLEIGLEKGREEKRLAFLDSTLKILNYKFNKIPQPIGDQINNLSDLQIQNLNAVSISFATIKDLENWLADNL